MSLTYHPFVQILILKTCRMYNVFGSMSNHSIYAQIMAQSALTNGGRAVGLSVAQELEWLYGFMP